MSHVPAERCLEIIALLAEGANTLPLGEIAERLSLPKSGAHRLLSTLVDLGWVAKEPDTGFYRLTMRLAVMGQRFYAATGIPNICQPVLDRLAHETREFVRLAVADGDTLVWLAQAQGATAGLIYQPPSSATGRVTVYSTATGKAWLASMPRDRAIQIVASMGFGEADRQGPNVVRSIEDLLKELALTEKRGYAVAVSEAEPGVSAVAVPIRVNGLGTALGTVSVAGPSVRMTAEQIEEIAPKLQSTASELAELWPLRPSGTALRERTTMVA
ncbi:IclR family transcriptional regulator [Caballeronia sp. GAWG1-1]|uniref:IclR family transcriptional regulator n=1 Tax=Caballeronia sp. GAWG1-1 TaxID=2921742 RepID=UPI0020280D2C|nr:IclR family transcriptional regulator [Caballeronia sp. GAWG1-1]